MKYLVVVIYNEYENSVQEFRTKGEAKAVCDEILKTSGSNTVYLAKIM